MLESGLIKTMECAELWETKMVADRAEW